MFRSFFLIGLLALGVSPSLLTSQTVTGTAGVYDDSFVGKKTASGTSYDPKALTAALDDLRFGIRMAVTNLTNGRTVTVLLNDDGPRKGHLIDLSKAAAELLEITGTAPVKIRLLQADEKEVTVLPSKPAPAPAPAPTPTPMPAPSPTPQIFHPLPLPDTFFQMGAFRTEGNARFLAKSLLAAGHTPKIRHDGVFFRVYLETDEAGAQALAAKLASEGRKGYLEVFKEPSGTPLPLTTE